MAAATLARRQIVDSAAYERRKTNNPPASVGQAARELSEFLASGFDEEKLEDALYHQLGLGIMPSYWDLTFRGWLEEVLKILEEPMEKTKKQFIPPFR